MKHFVKFRIPLLLMVTLLGSGCLQNSPQAVFYTLTALDADTGMEQKQVMASDSVIAVGPVNLPDELDRSSIVTRSGDNQLTINEFHRWGGSLEKNFTQVVIENISLLLQSDYVIAKPWERYVTPDLRIALDVKRFGGRLGEYAVLDATWIVFKKGKDTPLVMKRANIEIPVETASYDGLVGAQSRAVADLCQKITLSLPEI